MCVCALGCICFCDCSLARVRAVSAGEAEWSRGGLREHGLALLENPDGDAWCGLPCWRGGGDALRDGGERRTFGAVAQQTATHGNQSTQNHKRSLNHSLNQIINRSFVQVSDQQVSHSCKQPTSKASK